MNTYFSMMMLALACVVVVMLILCLIGIASVLEDVCIDCEDDSETDSEYESEDPAEAGSRQQIPVSNEEKVRERTQQQCATKSRTRA